MSEHSETVTEREEIVDDDTNDTNDTVAAEPTAREMPQDDEDTLQDNVRALCNVTL